MSTVTSEDRVLSAHLRALRVGPRLLACGRPDGPLAGIPTVVKDLIDVAGIETGAGSPDFLAEAAPASTAAPAVERLLAAGVSVIGKAHTDELAFSLSGTNVHYGTPLNPRSSGRVPGGSSSGSASAVAGGLVPLAVGTDTGGSIRVPASYCGVFGFRPTHGRVPLAGVVELAPSFGTVGLLAASGALLARAGWALIGSVNPDNRGAHTSLSALVVADDLLAEADPPVAEAVAASAETLGERLEIPVLRGWLQQGRLSGWLSAFRGRQMVEAWASHGKWIQRRRPRLGPGIAARFEEARLTPVHRAEAAAAVGAEVRATLEQLLPPLGALVLPSAATVAPPLKLEGPVKDDLRRRTLSLTCVAGLGGLPALSVPLAEAGGLPVGVCLVGRRGNDERLLAAVEDLGPWRRDEPADRRPAGRKVQG